MSLHLLLLRVACVAEEGRCAAWHADGRVPCTNLVVTRVGMHVVVTRVVWQTAAGCRIIPKRQGARYEAGCLIVCNITQSSVHGQGGNRSRIHGRVPQSICQPYKSSMHGLGRPVYHVQEESRAESVGKKCGKRSTVAAPSASMEKGLGLQLCQFHTSFLVGHGLLSTDITLARFLQCWLKSTSHIFS